jgi:hypothetical protein
MEPIDAMLHEYECLVERLYEIATNTNAPSAFLKKLSKLSDIYILTGLSCNPSTPPDVLEKMLETYCGVDGTDEEMRLHIVQNPNLSDEVLAFVAHGDPSEEIKDAATISMALRVASQPDVKREKLVEIYNQLNTATKNMRRREDALTKLAMIMANK